MNARRNLLIALGAGTAALAFPAIALQEKRVRRIGHVSGSTIQSNPTWLAGFRRGMSELRWVEGRDYVIDERYADGDVKAVPGLISALVATQPDLLLVATDESARQYTQRTKTIPIVFCIAQDPVGNGLVDSLRRPGRNVTGMSNLSPELATVRLQLLKEMSARISHVAMLYQPGDAGNVSQAKQIEQAAGRLKIRITAIELRQIGDVESALKRGAAGGAQAYIVNGGLISVTRRDAILSHVARARVPGIYGTVSFVEAGGLMSYGASFSDNFRRAAAYVDKIFKGAKPGDLPIEQPTKFEMVVNMKTAKAMGVAIPQSILLRADRVIE